MLQLRILRPPETLDVVLRPLHGCRQGLAGLGAIV
jgi:hypothetical protein